MKGWSSFLTALKAGKSKDKCRQVLQDGALVLCPWARRVLTWLKSRGEWTHSRGPFCGPQSAAKCPQHLNSFQKDPPPNLWAGVTSPTHGLWGLTGTTAVPATQASPSLLAFPRFSACWLRPSVRALPW